MQSVANVNGVEVYSNKNLTGVSGTRLSFSDGSWCDVHTGQVHNNGPGYIQVGGSPSEGESSDEEIVWGPMSFLTTTLEVSGVNADVEVEVRTGGQSIVEMEGPKSVIDGIRVQERGQTLVIQGDGSGGGDSVYSNIQIGGGRGGGMSMSIGCARGRVEIHGGSISVTSGGGSQDGPKAKIKIQVPRGTNTSFDGVDGSINVGDTEGDIALTMQGRPHATVGRVKNVNVTTQGRGGVDIAEASGVVNVTTQGRGHVRVRGGQVGVLNATCMGRGGFDFGGTAQMASLTTMGRGDITVERVINRPSRTSMGRGSITVNQIG